MDSAQDQRTGCMTGEMLSMSTGTVPLREDWRAVEVGNLQCIEGRTGTVLWREHLRCTLEGALEKATGYMTGAVHWWSTVTVPLSDEGELWRQEWNNVLEGELEQCHGWSTGAVQWREARISAGYEGQKQCSGKKTGAEQWKEQWTSTLDVCVEKCSGRALSAFEGRMESRGGRNGALHWVRTGEVLWCEQWSRAVEGALEQCTGCMTG